MTTVIEDTWFASGTKIRIGGGLDEVLFRRCSFDGGEIFIGDDVDRTIFMQCIFRGTSFTGQLLTERIAIACQSASPGTEETAPIGGFRKGKFRS